MSRVSKENPGQHNPRICIAMLDPIYGGGILTLLREFSFILSQWGIRSDLLYLSASDSALTPRQLLRHFRLWGVRHKTNLGFSGLAIGHVFAHFLCFAYFWRYPAVHRYIHNFDMYMVIGGALRGLTFALARKPFIIWVPTLFADEYMSRVEAGDDYARKVLASPALPLIVAQEKFALNRASLILSTSRYTANRIASTCPKVVDRIRVVPCPVEIPQFDGPSPTTSQTRDVICVGRLSDPRKNIDHLLEAFSVVSRKQPDARLLLIGGTGDQALPSRLVELGIQDRVLDLGRVSDAELLDYYQRATVFALPSRQEGLGIVALEAMAHGVPVVSTRCGGPEDHVVSGKTGFLVDKDDAEAMAKAILRLLNDRSLHKQMSQAARDHGKKVFSRTVVAGQFYKAFMDVYPDVISGLNDQA